MPSYSWLRGHRTIYDPAVGHWTYLDGASTDAERPCVRCGQMPLLGGEDACIGHVDGMESTCCGHGVHESIWNTEGNS